VLQEAICYSTRNQLMNKSWILFQLRWFSSFFLPLRRLIIELLFFLLPPSSSFNLYLSFWVTVASWLVSLFSVHNNPDICGFPFQIEKTVFVVFFSGEQARTKILKICEAFGANCYPVPEDISKQRQITREVSVLQLGLCYFWTLKLWSFFHYDMWLVSTQDKIEIFISTVSGRV